MESIAEARSAIERDPIASLFPHILSLVLGEARRYDEEVAAAQAGIALDSNYAHLHMQLGHGLVHLGRSDEGIEALRRAATLAPDVPVEQSWLGLRCYRQRCVACSGRWQRFDPNPYLGR